MLETISKVDNTNTQILGNELTQTLSNPILEVEESQFFNEMSHADGAPREEFLKIQQNLSGKSLKEIENLNLTAKQHFIDEGITFNVYGTNTGEEQIIPFDFIPRIIEKKQWDILEIGCKQRVRALNAFLHDVYHEQAILNDGVIP